MGGCRITPIAGRLAVEEATQRPYGEASEHLRRDHRIELSKHRLEQLTQTIGEYWLEQDERVLQRLQACSHHPQGLPQGTQEPADQCVIYADGVMVHTDKAWHEARVGVVRTQRGDQMQKSALVRLADPQSFGRQLWSKAAMMGCHQAKTLAFVADGSHWLWRMCDRHFDGAIRILDFYHLAQHVHDCANIHFGDATEEAKQWAMQTLGTLRAGEVDQALARVEALPGRGKLKRQAKHELITYLSNNRQRMDYPRYEKLGLPIGSGEVESACKTLVQKRCKQAGMRWKSPGLETLLRVRCAVADDTYRLTFGHWPENLTAWTQRRKAA